MYHALIDLPSICILNYFLYLVISEEMNFFLSEIKAEKSEKCLKESFLQY